jgi:hypothetical protein
MSSQENTLNDNNVFLLVPIREFENVSFEYFSKILYFLQPIGDSLAKTRTRPGFLYFLMYCKHICLPYGEKYCKKLYRIRKISDLSPLCR